MGMSINQAWYQRMIGEFTNGIRLEIGSDFIGVGDGDNLAIPNGYTVVFQHGIGWFNRDDPTGVQYQVYIIWT